VTTPRTTDELRSEIEAKREQLAHAVDHLRGELGVAAKLKARLPLFAAGAAATGFVVAGGVGALMRYLARRSRER
jgi:Protein of unknown function (DUF3618)